MIGYPQLGMKFIKDMTSSLSRMAMGSPVTVCVVMHLIPNGGSL